MMPDLFERQMLRVRNGLAYLTGANQPTVGQSPRDLIWKRDKARLWRYRSGQRRYRPPLLIVHSLVSKSYVLDLLPNTSMVGYLVGEGFDVFLLDWMPPDPADAENTLETYVDDYIPGAIGALLKDAVAREVTLIGYCFGGVLTLLVTAGHPELPVRNMIVMATPCDYREMGFMSNMFAEGRLEADDVIGETGLVPARALDEGFQILKPTDQLVQQVSFLENLWNDEFVQGFLAIGQWARDQVPFPGAAFRQTVSLLIRQNALFAGVIPLGRTEVHLKDIRCPFLNAFAEQDGITPAASSEPLTRLVGSDDASELRLQSGHIGFVVGRQAAKVAQPQIADWIRRRSDEA
jgi:polyhydroxyalkanoate synthase